MEATRRLTFFRMAGLLAVLVGLLLPASASAADSIYWSREESPQSIRVGNLDGSVAPDPQTLFNDGGAPCGVALDPAAGKIYWANCGGADPGREPRWLGHGHATLITGQDNPCGVAVDPAAGRIYWAKFCQVRDRPRKSGERTWRTSRAPPRPWSPAKRSKRGGG